MHAPGKLVSLKSCQRSAIAVYSYTQSNSTFQAVYMPPPQIYSSPPECAFCPAILSMLACMPPFHARMGRAASPVKPIYVTMHHNRHVVTLMICVTKANDECSYQANCTPKNVIYILYTQSKTTVDIIVPKFFSKQNDLGEASSKFAVMKVFVAKYESKKSLAFESNFAMYYTQCTNPVTFRGMMHFGEEQCLFARRPRCGTP
jgi:hypothetical protein